jgi:uncharacterized protein (DUF608 family)
MANRRDYNGWYEGEFAPHIAFPLGGMGAGMVCLDGGGALTKVSVRNRPELLHEPFTFAAVSLNTKAGVVARLLEGQVPSWKVTYPWPDAPGTGRGQQGKTFGLPRFSNSRFAARFPFCEVELSDPALPIACTLTAWSPFIPGDDDASSLPLAALEYSLTNNSAEKITGAYSFHTRNFMRAPPTRPFGIPEDTDSAVLADPAGFTLFQDAREAAPEVLGHFSVQSMDGGAQVNPRWFRGDWWDPVTDLWRTIARGETPSASAYDEGTPSAGGSLFVPFELQPGETRRFEVLLSWFVPRTALRRGGSPFDMEGRADGTETHVPRYAALFKTHEELATYWRANYSMLRRKSAAFRDALFDANIPPAALEAVAANLSILKSPTVMRQADGRIWFWEGCADNEGSFEGNCSHVYNYAQALAHLFPRLERGMRETEFFDGQDETGHQNFRIPLPIRPYAKRAMPAADGQLGGLLKLYRDWRISGDNAWLQKMWPRAKNSLEYCIRTWDPERQGLLTEPHHNTYDIEFWGPDGMCSSIYLGALRAATAICAALGEPANDFSALADRAQKALQAQLYNGEYFVQKVQWDDRALKARQSEETRALVSREGPKYQYGTGCLSDGVIGAWFARVCGVDGVLDSAMVHSHLKAVHQYNFRRSLLTHANPQRPAFALGDEAALLLCSWPRGGAPAFPFVYSDEAWTGIEYQVASHLILCGEFDAGVEIVEAARDRYDGRVRNPFSEFEWGHWYGRALSSYALLQAFTGQDYDARTQSLRIAPAVAGDVRALLVTETGYGTAGVRDGKPFLDVREGSIPVREMIYVPATSHDRE